MNCSYCEERRHIVFARQFHTLDNKEFNLHLCKECVGIFICVLLDHTLGGEYQGLVVKYGKEITNAKSIQNHRKINGKRIRKKERNKIRKHEVESRTQRNRTNRRKRKEVKC